MPINDAYSQSGVPRPQQPPVLYQPPVQPPQVPPFVQNSHGNQADLSSTSVGNQQSSHVLTNSSMNNNGTNDQTISDAPQWACTLMNTLNTRLQNIETHISNQNQKWLSIDSQMQSQNNRMANIEGQLSQINDMKRSVGNVQLKVSNVDERVNSIQVQMNAYDKSIEHFNNLCDGIVSENSSSSTFLHDLDKRVSKLETDSMDMYDQHAKMEEKLIDLQWRSMRENLIFTGIHDPGDPKEDTESTLRTFLSDEMNIHYEIPFDRVHRLGKYESTKSRPIIAKFERFRDRERVRLAAPKALQGKDYGVREQFPVEIENKRRVLYPIMKRYKQNSQNKVVLARDKLYINDVQYIPSDSDINGNDNKQNDNKRYERGYQRERTQGRDGGYQRERVPGRDGGYQQERVSGRDGRYQREHVSSRTFTRRFNPNMGYKGGSRNSTENGARWGDGASGVETPNRFRHLQNVNDDNEILSQSSHGKRKATSPLQEQTALKKISSELSSDPQAEKHHSEMTITISSPSQAEPLEAPLLDSNKKTQVTSENQGTLIRDQSGSRDSSPDSRNAVNDEIM